MNHRGPLAILYRGPLTSCDADCDYCPFAKRRDTPQTLAADRAALERFVGWVRENPQGHARIDVLFTPWGEALTRSWYRRAMVELSHLPHLGRVAVQTNLRARLEWLAAAAAQRVGIWATYHPGQIPRDRFVAQCRRLEELGIEHSAGIVGLEAHLEEARALRRALPRGTYLWVNAADGVSYTDVEIERWSQIDPLFGAGVGAYPSRGQACRAGDTVVSVDGDGTVLPCHFDARALGNLYRGDYLTALGTGTCGLDACDCHIGYVHLPSTRMYEVYGGTDRGALHRVPLGWPRVPERPGRPPLAPGNAAGRTPRSIPTANRPAR